MEQPKILEKTGDIDQSKIESMFGKSLRCFKRLSRAGATIGAFLIAGELAHVTKQSIEYDRYIDSSLSTEDLTKKEANEKTIKVLFGEDVVIDIESADQEAFFERKSKDRKMPDVKGFTERGWTNKPKYGFTEKYLYYPKGWLAGEVGQIVFIDSIITRSFGGNNMSLLGGLKRETFSAPSLFLFRGRSRTGVREGSAPVDQRTIDHEFGHANDWRTDMDLNILERQELLLRIHGRLTADNSYHNKEFRYHEVMMDVGNKKGLYQAATEYWAEICAEYFSDPKSFLEKHPKDFKLVDDYSRKNDPSFDIFNPNRGAFDTQTGKLKEFWRDK